MKKPIKVFWSEQRQRFYASSHYKVKSNCVVITGEKFDVTDDIAANVIKHDIKFSREICGGEMLYDTVDSDEGSPGAAQEGAK